MRIALKLMEQNVIKPAVMITHIGGLNAVADTIINLPKILGGKKLIYTNIKMNLTALEDFKNLQDKNSLFGGLYHIAKKNRGLWSLEAEEYLLVNAENKAFPSYETIAKKGSMAKVQAKRVVKSLIQKGLLKKEARKNKNNKSYTSNLYTLLNPKTRENNDKNGVVSDRYQGGVHKILGVVSHRYPNNTNLKNTNLNNVNRVSSEEVVENSVEVIEEKNTEDS